MNITAAAGSAAAAVEASDVTGCATTVLNSAVGAMVQSYGSTQKL